MNRNFVLGWRATVLVAACLAGAVMPASARAQTTTGTIRGFVRDAQGAPVADAQIGVTSPGTGIARGATTEAEGFYNLAGLRPGDYDLTVRRIGSTPQTRTVSVQIGQTLDLNFTLAAATTQLSTVTVTAAPTTETKTSEVATNVSQQQINTLPSPGRNILDLARLAPGVRITEDRIDAKGKTFAAGAQPAEQVNVFIDGVSFKNDITAGGVAGQDASRGNPFPRNAVQEFRVATSNYKAEYQKASSAIITAVTKSGTNVWEGSAFTAFQNERYVALDTFTRLSRQQDPANFKVPVYSRYLSGANIGGPLVRDKLFFFGSYEGNYQNREGVTRFFGNPATYPAAVAGINGTSHVAPFHSNLFFGKLTYNQSEKQLLEFSFDARLENEQRDFGGQSSCQCAAYSTGDYFHSNVLTGRGKHTLYGASGTNELLLSYQRFQFRNEAFDFNTPRSDYAGIGLIGGHEAQQDLRQNRLSLRDDYTFTTEHLGGGVHVPKIGGNIDFDRYDLNKQLNENPTFAFDPSNNYAFPVRALIGFGNPTVASNNTQIGLYAQDDWNPMPQLTINLGLRWDYESAMFNRSYVTPAGVRDTVTLFQNQFLVPVDPARYTTDGTQRKPFYGAFQPRVGFSYAIDEVARTTVFGGWGIYYDRLNFNATLDESYRRQHQEYQFNFAQTASPGVLAYDPKYFSRQGLLNAIASGQAPPQEVFLIPNDLKPPHSMQWSAGLRHDFGGWNASGTYSNTKSENGFSFDFANVGFIPGQGRNCCKVVSGLPYRTVLVGNNDVHTWYSSVQVQLDRPYRRNEANYGWGGGIAYTIARAEAEGGDLFSFPSVAENPRHPISDDERHHIVANFVTDIPYAWGIQFSGLIVLGSGTPFNRAFATTTRGFIVDFGVSRPATSSFLLPGDAFAYRNVDVRLRKDFANVGGNRVGITADVFNLYNFNNFGCFNDFYGSYDANQKFTPATDYGRPNCVVSDPRRLQIGIQYDFGLTQLMGRGGR
ncbi:MAG: TonB-dependent receptor [Gemmatimonadaceae bacterium]